MSSVQSSAVSRDEELNNEVNVTGEKIGYDLSRFDNSETVRGLRSEEAGAVPGSKKRVKPKMHLTFLTAVCCAAATAVAGLLLMSYLNLTVINDEIAKLENKYTELCNENVLLQTEYESRYDLNEVEEYAVKNLGMIKLERSQVEYVEITSPDSIRAVSPEENETSSYISANFVKSFNAVLDFFQNRGE